ncbi:MAG: hypothetical protein ACKOZN_11595 [Cyanobium sp.]
MGRPQPPPRRSGRLRWIAIALAGAAAAAAALIVAGPIDQRPQPAPTDPGATAEGLSRPPAPPARGRSAAELNEALQGSASPPPAGPSLGGKGAKPAGSEGAVAWEALSQRCFEDVGRSTQGPPLRLLESTGFVPQGAQARTRLGFDWDQAVRLTLEPSGGGKAVGIECYFLKGNLVGKSRG